MRSEAERAGGGPCPPSLTTLAPCACCPLQCYCFVCDCLASECRSWGSGSSRAHHCNAHAGHHIYQTLRGLRTAREARSAALAPAAAGNAGSAPGRPDDPAHDDPFAGGPSDSGDEDGDYYLLKGLAPPRKAATNVAAASSQLVKLPDPEADPHLVKLGTVHLRCRVRAGVSAAAVGLPAVCWSGPAFFAGAQERGLHNLPRFEQQQQQGLTAIHLPLAFCLFCWTQAVKGKTIEGLEQRLVPNGFYAGWGRRDTGYGDR